MEELVLHNREPNTILSDLCENNGPHHRHDPSLLSSPEILDDADPYKQVVTLHKREVTSSPKKVVKEVVKSSKEVADLNQVL